MTEPTKKNSPRRRARECAVQALYSWYLSNNPIEQIELTFFVDQEDLLLGVDKPYFRKLLRETAAHIDEIDDYMIASLDRDLTELDPIERAILRLAVYELKFEQDVPYRVVINEAIEVAKVFGAEDSHKYVNAVLDKLALRLALK